METETIPIWQNKPHGSTRSVVRMIGTSLPLKPCRRVCFELVPGLSAVDSLHSVYGTGPPVPTLADVAWIAADEGEAFTRLRADVRPFREEWHPTPLLIMHRNSSVPNFRREGRRHETLKKPGLAALNRTVALQDELSRLREQIAKIVAVQESDEDATESAAFTPELGSPDTTSIACSLPEFESVYPSLASFTINDITETDEPDCMSLSSFSIAGTSNFDFEKKDLKDDDDDDDGEVVSLSKSTSFADMMDILKDMNRVKLHSLQGSKGDSLRENDPAVRISEALKRKFTVQDNGIFLNEN